MATVLELLFFASVVVPPAVVVLGMLALLLPRRPASTVGAPQGRAHAH